MTRWLCCSAQFKLKIRIVRIFPPTILEKNIIRIVFSRMELKFEIIWCILLSIFVAHTVQKDPFCPLEKNGNMCVSSSNQFKCGAFFIDLDGQNETLRWIGALPDMLRKPSVRKSPEMKAIFRNMHKKTFRTIPGFCNEIYANQKCYRLMKDFTKIPLDSCEHSFFNEYADRTVGDILCQRASLFAPGQHFQSFVKIGFYHSGCGGNWTETHFKGQPLLMEEELCCRYLEGRGRYFRCDGSHFETECKKEKPITIETKDGVPKYYRKYL